MGGGTKVRKTIMDRQANDVSSITCIAKLGRKIKIKRDDTLVIYSSVIAQMFQRVWIPPVLGSVIDTQIIISFSPRVSEPFDIFQIKKVVIYSQRMAVILGPRSGVFLSTELKATIHQFHVFYQTFTIHMQFERQRGNLL